MTCVAAQAEGKIQTVTNMLQWNTSAQSDTKEDSKAAKTRGMQSDAAIYGTGMDKAEDE